MLYVYQPKSFRYVMTIEKPDFTHENHSHATKIPILPLLEMTDQIFDLEKQQWCYVPANPSPDVKPNDIWLDTKLTYAEIRKREYPPLLDYIDGMVKNNQEQIDTYLQKCRDIKTTYPKDMSPMSIRELYQQKGIFEPPQEEPVVEENLPQE